MKIPTFILALCFGAVLTLQGWVLATLDAQGKEIASIKTAIHFLTSEKQQTLNLKDNHE